MVLPYVHLFLFVLLSESRGLTAVLASFTLLHLLIGLSKTQVVWCFVFNEVAFVYYLLVGVF